MVYRSELSELHLAKSSRHTHVQHVSITWAFGMRTSRVNGAFSISYCSRLNRSFCFLLLIGVLCSVGNRPKKGLIRLLNNSGRFWLINHGCLII